MVLKKIFICFEDEYYGGGFSMIYDKNTVNQKLDNDYATVYENSKWKGSYFAF